MVSELMSAFKQIYDDEVISKYMYVEHKKELYIQCSSGYSYKVSYNDGCIETICLN